MVEFSVHTYRHFVGTIYCLKWKGQKVIVPNWKLLKQKHLKKKYKKWFYRTVIISLQLQETLVKFEQTEENLQKERRGTVDRQQQSNRQLHTVEAELTTANNKIRELRDEMQKKQNQIMRQEADKVGHSVSYG